MTRVKNLFFIFIWIFLTGCGFHPRGALPLAPALHDIYFKTASPYSQLSRNLREYFIASGVYLAAIPNDSALTLEVLSDAISQQLISVSGTQLTRQYNLILTVTFRITDSKGAILVPTQALTEVRVITVQADQTLAGSNEANTMYQQMRQAIVFDIMNRLASRDLSTMLMTAQKKI